MNVNVPIYKENSFRYKHVKCAHNRQKKKISAEVKWKRNSRKKNDDDDNTKEKNQICFNAFWFGWLFFFCWNILYVISSSLCFKNSTINFTLRFCFLLWYIQSEKRSKNFTVALEMYDILPIQSFALYIFG